MKKIIFTLLVSLFAISAVRAIPFEEARRRSLFLTDKMAYELNLNIAQYNDAYEINLDYFLSLRTARDADGYLLQRRNDDMRYILYSWQYERFRASKYLFHPVTWRAGIWYYPIYVHYHADKFFYPHPKIYWSYRGGHNVRRNNRSYYANRRPVWNGGLREPGKNHKPERPKPHVTPKPEKRPKPQNRPKPVTRPKPGNGQPERKPNIERRPKVERQKGNTYRMGYNHESSTRATVNY